MKKLALKTLIPAAFIASTISATPAGAVAKFKINDESTVWISLLLQLRGEWTEDGQVDGSGWRSDFYIRRARILFGGTINKYVDFFVETDNPNMGKDKKVYDNSNNFIGYKSDNDTKTFIQDAWIRLKFAKEFNIVMGQILLPFSHNNATGATSLLGLDYNLTVVKFPPTSHFVWRDYGVEVMGLVSLPKGSLDYRIGLFDGVESVRGTGVTVNKDDNYRVTGRLQYNLFDSEGFYYKGTYLGKKKIVSFGAGIDYQKDGAADNYTTPTKVDDYKAWTVDMFIDYPLENGDVPSFQAGYIDYDYGNTGHANDGTAIYAQAGYLFNKQMGIGKIEPIVRYQSFDSSTGTDDTGLYLGVAYWIDGFRANLKAEYEIDGGDGKDQDVFTIQAQILF